VKNFADAATQLGSILTLIISLVVLWTAVRAVFILLATISRKLTILRSLFISLRGEFRALQKFLKVHHGYHIREDIQDVQDDLLKQYDSDDTGF